MIVSPMVQVLIDAGFSDGWGLDDDVLVLWEHQQDPPLPLTRPKEQVIDDAD
jgi:hypothetical protein